MTEPEKGWQPPPVGEPSEKLSELMEDQAAVFRYDDTAQEELELYPRSSVVRIAEAYAAARVAKAIKPSATNLDYDVADKFLPELVEVHQDRIVDADLYEVRRAIAIAISQARAEAEAKAVRELSDAAQKAVAEARAQEREAVIEELRGLAHTRNSREGTAIFEAAVKLSRALAEPQEQT